MEKVSRGHPLSYWASRVLVEPRPPLSYKTSNRLGNAAGEVHQAGVELSPLWEQTLHFVFFLPSRCVYMGEVRIVSSAAFPAAASGWNVCARLILHCACARGCIRCYRRLCVRFGVTVGWCSEGACLPWAVLRGKSDLSAAGWAEQFPSSHPPPCETSE